MGSVSLSNSCLSATAEHQLFSFLKKQNKETLDSKHPNMACCTGAFKSLGEVGIFFLCHRQCLLHDGPVQRRFNVIFTVAWIDHSLSLPLLSDLLLCEDLREAHIRSYWLREKPELVTRTLINSLPAHAPTARKKEASQGTWEHSAFLKNWPNTRKVFQTLDFKIWG